MEERETEGTKEGIDRTFDLFKVDERKDPMNSGERYMREHYNNGKPVPQVVDKTFCGTVKRHRFRFLLLVILITVFLLFVAGITLYILL